MRSEERIQKERACRHAALPKGYVTLVSHFFRPSHTTLTQIAAADYAEAMPVLGTVEAGEVVSASPAPNPTGADIYNQFYVERATKPYDEKLVGIVSSFTDSSSKTPSTSPAQKLIALVGRVPVKVSLENGPMQVGDYLTASATKPGYAMRWSGFDGQEYVLNNE